MSRVNQNYNRNRNRNRNTNYNREREWSSPESEDRYNYNSDECKEFEKLLKKHPWNQHRWYGDLQSDNANTLCDRITKHHKIPNSITDSPTDIFPYQAAFASKYGYIPKGHSLPKRATRRSQRIAKKSQNPSITREKRSENRRNKRKINIDIWEANKQRKRTKRNKNKRRRMNRSRSTKKQISHICGKKSCITIDHLELANSKENNDRFQHHKKLDKIINKLQQNKKDRITGEYGGKQTIEHRELQSDEGCDCIPHCFRNHGMKNSIIYHVD